MALYDKPVRVLTREMVASFGMTDIDTFDRDQAVKWFQDHYPLVKEGTVTGHLTRQSTNVPARINHMVKPGDDDLFFYLGGGRYRLYNAASDPSPIYKAGVEAAPAMAQFDKPVAPAAHDGELSEFAYERDLRNFLVKNLTLIEPGLRIYEDEGIKGVEFPCGGRYIDILAVGHDTSLVVIELKVSAGHDRVVGQLLRYMGWIEEHQADPGQKVRGIIVANKISSDLIYACARLPDVKLFEYDLSVSLRPITTKASS